MVLSSWGVPGVTFSATSGGKQFLPRINTAKNPRGTVDASGVYGLNLMFDLNENEEFEDYKKPKEIVRFPEEARLAGMVADLQPALRLNKNAFKISNR